MARIAEETEKQLTYEVASSTAKNHIPAVAGVISRAACNAAYELKSKAIISATKSGATAERISNCRPDCTILAVTPSERVAKKLALRYGVTAIVAEEMTSTDEIMEKSVQIAREKGYVEAGDTVVLAAGVPANQVGKTNLLRITEVK